MSGRNVYVVGTNSVEALTAQANRRYAIDHTPTTLHFHSHYEACWERDHTYIPTDLFDPKETDETIPEP